MPCNLTLTILSVDWCESSGLIFNQVPVYQSQKGGPNLFICALVMLPFESRFVEIFCEKRRENAQVTMINRSYLILPRIQHKVALLVLLSIFAVCFWLLNFLQIGDGPSVVVLYLCFNFTIVLVLHVRLNFTTYSCSEFYGQDWLQTYRYETRQLWGLFAEVREKSVLRFWYYWHFLWKCSFKHMPISQTFLYL